MQNVYHIYIENENKKKKLAQKSRCPTASFSGPANFPMVKTDFSSFFTSPKKKISLPKTTSFWGDFNQKKLCGPARERKLTCGTQGADHALHALSRARPTLSPLF
uniref:Uncharacterized protein n=1 Tax=Opuntia streptacantha TaxID=393608 RepID=A0A7C9DH07_OPUST